MRWLVCEGCGDSWQVPERAASRAPRRVFCSPCLGPRLRLLRAAHRALGIIAAVLMFLWALAVAGEARAQPPVVRLDAGTPAPFAGHLVVDSAWLQLGRSAAVCDQMIPDLRAEVERVRAERDACLTDAAQRLDVAAERVEVVAETVAAVPESPSRARWAGAATLAALVAGGAAYVALEETGGRAQDLGALAGVVLGGGVVVLVGGVFD